MTTTFQLTSRDKCENFHEEEALHEAIGNLAAEEILVLNVYNNHLPVDDKQATKPVEAMVGVRVTSSTINAVAYDPTSRCMYVFFSGRSWYRYLNVPAEVFIKVARADSVGQSFHLLVKSAGFSYNKMVL